jgi:hypothetical protein
MTPTPTAPTPASHRDPLWTAAERAAWRVEPTPAPRSPGGRGGRDPRGPRGQTAERARRGGRSRGSQSQSGRRK